ncbi:MAG TPA: MoaD/ThiS family protein [Gemmatimonadales bacterium]|jgi:molybdopterin converting factor small subunit
MTAAAPATVAVHVLLFASYAERLGFESLELRLPASETVAGVVERIRALPGGNGLPIQPLCAVNLTHVPLEYPVTAGDEIAILPPLAGG